MANIPQDGRLTSFNTLTGTLTGSEVMYIVSPGNAVSGLSYQVTTQTLGIYFASFLSSNPTVIKTGTSYNSINSDFRILMDLTVAAPFTVTLLPSAQYTQPILIKDVAGNISSINTITIGFSGGQTADGLSSVVLQIPYEGIWLNPYPAAVGNGFYVTQA
jgi:hypothetical protein